MNQFKSSDNDGTLIISDQVPGPMQGTWVAENSDGVIVAKGIVRPCLRNPITEEVENEAHVADAAFGKNMKDAPKGNFYKIGVLGRRNWKLNMQTVLFAAKDPAALINADNKRFASLTALDLLSKESKRKVSAGVSPSLLIDAMSPSDLFRKLETKGIRSTAYASTLVDPTSTAPLWRQSGTEVEKLERAISMAIKGKDMPHFMLLPKSAEELAKQCDCSEADLCGRVFLIHRDPSLPDATSLFPCLYLGTLEWNIPCKKVDQYGIVFHPNNQYWLNAGGDFDGDDAAVVVPHTGLLPKGPITRPNFVRSTLEYRSTDVTTQMLEAANNSVTSLLGPAIMAASKLIERGVATDDHRAEAAAVAQGAVSAKKHSVDVDAITATMQYLNFAVADNSNDGTHPYFSSMLNALKNASGVKAKQDVWTTIVSMLPIWRTGSPIEQAFTNRVELLDQLFKDTEFFRMQERPELPQSMIDAAKAECPATVRDAIREIADEYRALAISLNGDEYTIEDDDERTNYIAAVQDDLRILRSEFELAAITGIIRSLKVSPTVAQNALVAHAPARIAARFVSAEVFEHLGLHTKRALINIINRDKPWVSGIYKANELHPIPNCVNSFNMLTRLSETVHIQVVSIGRNSTRVLATINT